MRPLKSSSDIATLEGATVYESLIQAYGPYCAFSEDPIWDVARVWTKDATIESAMLPARRGGEAALLLSPATFLAWQDRREMVLADPLRPDIDLTFRLADSPFVYNLEPVRIGYVDEEGGPDGEPEDRELAIVRGFTPQAEATIDLFALNGEYFDSETNGMTIPRHAYLAREDPRIFNRTNAWMRAEQVAGRIADAPADTRNLYLDQTRAIAAAVGFWSVWATVFWRRFQDRDIVARVLMEPEAVGLGSTGPGIHNAFPGTRSDWIS